MLMLTLNTVSTASMWMKMPAPETVSEAMSHCDLMKMATTEVPEDNHSVSTSDTRCNMDNCQCDGLNTAKVPDDPYPYIVPHNASSASLSMSNPSLLTQFIPPNQRPPRMMSA